MFIFLLLLKLLLWILLILIGILLFFLIIPMKYDLRFKDNEKITLSAKLSSLSHVVDIFIRYFEGKPHLNIKLFGIIIKNKIITHSKDKNSKKKEKPEKKEKKTDKKKFNPKEFLEKEFLNDCLGLLKDILFILKPDTLKINGSVGFEDPSATGYLCAVIPALTNLFSSNNINITPVFDDEIIDVDIQIAGKVILIKAIVKLLKFILKKNNRKRFFKKHQNCEA